MLQTEKEVAQVNFEIWGIRQCNIGDHFAPYQFSFSFKKEIILLSWMKKSVHVAKVKAGWIVGPFASRQEWEEGKG